MVKRRTDAVKLPREPVAAPALAANDADGDFDPLNIIGRVEIVRGAEPPTMLIGTQRVLVADVERALTGVLARTRADAADQPVQGHLEERRDAPPSRQRERTAPGLDLRDEPLRDVQNLGNVLLGEPGHRADGSEAAADAGSAGVVDALHVQKITGGVFSEQGEDVDRRFGAAVKAARKAAGIRQQVLAASAKMTQGRVSQLESGDPWSLEAAARVASALGVPIAELLGGTVLSPHEQRVIAAMRSGRAMEAVRVITEGEAG